MKYGDLGKRFLAAVIDSVILNAVLFLIGYAINVIGFISWTAYFGMMYAVALIAPFLNIIYYTAMEGSGWHATFGKRIMGLYVANVSGMGVSYSQAFLRNLAKIVSSITLLVGDFMCFFNPEKQCLHDLIAKAYVLEGNPLAIGSEPSLICVSGPLAGNIYKIPSSGLMIGRDTVTCQVIIPSNQANVSRNHCNVTYNSISDMFIVSDRNSTHGTFLANGRKIEYARPAALHSGGRFYIATPDNMFEVRL